MRRESPGLVWVYLLVFSWKNLILIKIWSVILLWSDIRVFYEKASWSSIERLLTWDYMLVLFGVIYEKKTSWSFFEKKNDMVFYVMKPHSWFWTSFSSFFMNIFWTFLSMPPDLPWEDRLMFYWKNTWSSIRRLSVPLWEDCQMFYGKTSWPSVKRLSGPLGMGEPLGHLCKGLSIFY